MFDLNLWQLAAAGIGTLAVIGLFIHFWPFIRDRVHFSDRVEKELDREHVDLETILADFDKFRAQLKVLSLKKQMVPATPAVVADPHVDLDKEIEALLAKKEALTKAQADLAAAQAAVNRLSQ